MKKIGVLGGTFDPVHIGHISLAKDALSKVHLDNVIFVPAKLQPFKLDKNVTEGSKRIEMLNLAIKDIPEFLVSTYEFENAGVSYTYKTMRALKKIYQKDQLFFICGTDSFLKVNTWKESKSFLSENSFIVGSRPGYMDNELNLQIKNLREKFGTNIIKIDNEQFSISSTEVRENFDSIKKYISNDVKGYIKDNGLYK